MEGFVEFAFTRIIIPLGVFLLIFMMAGLLFLIVGSAMGVKFPQERAYDHCIEDGLKDYQCYGMVYGRGK